ncbi:regulator of cell morphoproteinsis and NO signaling [Pseudidiomarina salinarum]|uniref:Regulator of cell morphoproteinsis and NO signaling n=1 Tax=Pseudidiomarina salinarum TaxID=435908 RepID=A0A094L7H3_9GAMM|nr:hemerythrin domain-containing protein [Pseudidiomarina salinarum]KFZ30718.1 regulator of cell morphoproteinsis and NO signaling [Pseudidiomarina salinarum]
MNTASLQHWREQPVRDLIEHILENYHQKHRQQLPDLINLSRKVESVHGDHPLAPAGLADHLSEMFQELESHMMKEEQILFPMLAGGIYPSGPINVMEEEHEQHEAMLEQLMVLAHQCKTPAGACGSWTALYAGVMELITDLRDHIELENTVLFVQPAPAMRVAAHGEGTCCGSCQ